MLHFLVNAETGAIYLKLVEGKFYLVEDKDMESVESESVDVQPLTSLSSGRRCSLTVVKGKVEGTTQVKNHAQLGRDAYLAWQVFKIKSILVEVRRAYNEVDDMPEELKKYMATIFEKTMGLVHQAVLEA